MTTFPSPYIEIPSSLSFLVTQTHTIACVHQEKNGAAHTKFCGVPIHKTLLGTVEVQLPTWTTKEK